MAHINPNIPIPGGTTSEEENKIPPALIDIVTVINGQLDNANVASNAGINGNKLANTSVDTAQLANNAVTTPKIANNAVTAAKLPVGGLGPEAIGALAILSGKIKFVFRSGFGSVNLSGNQICAQVNDVLPGTYLALGKYGISTDCHSPAFSSGGAVTISQAGSVNNVSNKMYGGGAAEYAFGHHMAMIQVNETAGIALTVNRSAASGVLIGEIQMFGVLAA
jgi:hypothetical protein